jgi:hypothetical protein
MLLALSENLMAKNRKKIPIKIADEVMFIADLLCCVCENRGDQIHHIDNDPSNNDLDNLVLLCFRHHDEVTRQGGLSRRLSPNLLRSYRTTLYRKVEAKRELPKIEESSSVSGQIDEGRLFQLMLDAVSIREIQKIIRQFDLDEDEKRLEAIYELSSYVESSGVRAPQEILEILEDIASRTRDEMTPEVARAVARVTYSALPVRNLRFPSEIAISDAEVELMIYGLEIGLHLSYDGALYIQDIKVVDAGGGLLWKILLYARINNHKELHKLALAEFDTAEDGAKRGGDKDTVKLLKLYRKHGLSGDWRNPIYGERLLNRIA